MTETYYTVPVMVVFQIAATFVSYKNRYKFKELEYFHLYPLCGLLQAFIAIFSMIFLQRSIGKKIEELSVNLFSISEAALFLYFSIKITQIKRLRKLLEVLFFVFTLYSIYSWSFTDSLFHNASKLIGAEALLALIAIYCYFFQLFTQPVVEKIIDKPAFWINLGFLFLFSCTLPLTALDFIQRVASPNFYLYYLNFLAYSVLYLIVIKAYLCKEQNKKIQVAETSECIILNS